MGDYDLSRLSTRSFEQLIQAIAAEEVGPRVVVFGDGPDGGREAAFQGPVAYRNWDGYGVVQAKFLQRHSTTKKDGDWAVNMLQRELQAYEDKDTKRRIPEYYIFATNVVLTPTSETGSKDRIIAILDEFKKRNDLRDYAIWDNDQICVFLDRMEPIRQAYAAWITPGDVLASVMKWVKTQSPDFENTLSLFLQKEMLADQYANLEQAGHASDDRVPIARVFVDLPAFNNLQTEPPDEVSPNNALMPGFIANVLEKSKERLDPSSQLSYKTELRRLGMPESIQPGRFVLVGGPGQGKSTIGQYLCQLHRAAILQNRPEHTIAQEVRDPLDAIISLCADECFELPSARRFPIRIVLSQLARALASKEDDHVDSLLAYIVARIKKRTERKIQPDDFRQWLRGYPWLLILDGLDEVPASSNRAQMLEAINEFWIDAVDCNADIIVIATTRPQGYNDDFSPNMYQHKWLAPLSIQRALRYATRLTQARYGTDSDRQEKVMSQLQRAASQDASARLMQSPLQVTILTTLIAQGGQPPRERWNLFKQYYDVIYKRELERDIPATAILQEHRHDIDTIHRHVGLLLQTDSERSGSTDARLPLNRFEQVVEHHLASAGHNETGLNKLKAKIVEAAASRLVFLVEPEAGQIGFEIRSLQEFMAAEALMEGKDDDVQQRLREIAPIPNWRNTFLFAAGKCFADRLHLRDTVHTICCHLNNDKEDRVAHSTMAGSLLALDLLDDGHARQQPNYHRGLTHLALCLLDVPVVDLHKRLAKLYEPSLEAVYYEEIQKRLRSSDHQASVGAWSCLIILASSAIEWADQVAKANWPPDDSVKYRLLNLPDFYTHGNWLRSYILTELPCLDNSSLAAHDFSIETPTQEHVNTDESALLASSYVTTTDTLTESAETITVRLAVPDQQRSVLRFVLRSIKGNENDSLKALLRYQRLGDLPLEWTPIISAAKFVKDPSHTILARELRIIAERTKLSNINFKRYFLPWPLGACLAENEQRNLFELADKAESGELGSLDDWLAAETRWREIGITSNDILVMQEPNWPLHHSISMQGYPFSACRSHATSDEELLYLTIESLAEIYTQLPRSDIRAFIAGTLCFLLGVFGTDGGAIDSTLMASKIKPALSESTSSIWCIPALCSLPWNAPLSIEDSAFLDEIGRRNTLFSLRGFHQPLLNKQQIVDTLSQAFVNDTNKHNFLRLLSRILIPDSACPITPDLLHSAANSAPTLRDAVMLIRLTQGVVEKDECTKLAEYIDEHSDLSPYIIESAMQAMSHERMTLSCLEEFLIELYLQAKNLPYIQSEAVGVLIDTLSRRNSRLVDAKVWSKLNLPTGLYELLQL